MTMVERVARAIARAEPLCLPWDEISEIQKTLFRTAARAAIEAMREPTEAMVDATFVFANEPAAAVYNAMIDAALSEGTDR